VSVELRYLARERGETGLRPPKETFWKSWGDVRRLLSLRFEPVTMDEIESGPLARFGPVDSALVQIARRFRAAGEDIELLTLDEPLRKFAREAEIPEASWPPSVPLLQ
jgi:hypothetical protein